MDTCTQCETKLPQDSLFCPRCGTPGPGADTTVDMLASSASDPTGLLDRLRDATEGEFEILRELGRGGMGRVYLAHELALERRVALKVLPPAFADHQPIVERFQREARTAGKLNHPHIVAVYQVSERAGLYFFTMPYVAGPSLRQVLCKTPQLNIGLARRYIRDAADALGFAHGQGVIHRDIKPENMLIEGSRDGRLLLTDFGIAKALGVGTTLTRPGDMMGTPYFMSPEQCEESEKIDGRSDQYSLGLVGYELLAGRFPFSADSMAAIVYKHLHEYPEPLAKVRPEVPEDLVKIIERSIRKDPNERFPTMHAMLEALGGKTLGDVGVGATARSARRPGWASRGGRWALTGALVVALGAAGAGAVWWQQRATDSGSGETQLADLGTALGEVSTTVLDTLTPAPDSVALVSDTASAQDEPEQEATDTAEPAVDRQSELQRRELAATRTQALGERDEALQARTGALATNADSIFPERFDAASGELRSANADLEGGRLIPAAVSFARAGDQFDELARQARQRIEATTLEGQQEDSPENPAGDGDQPTGEDFDESNNDPAANEPEPPIELPPEQAIASLLEVYRQAIEAEDIARMRDAVYMGAIPEEDAEYLDLWFRLADEFQVTIDVQDNMSLAGEKAELRIKQKMTYRLQRTGDRRDHTENLRMYFQRGTDGWRLLRFER